MTVCELILQLDDLLNLGVRSRLDESEEIEQAMQNDNCCKTLLACCNLVLNGLYADCELDVRSTVVESVNCFIDTSLFKMGRAKALVDSSGARVPFTYTYGGLNVKRDGKYNLTYVRLPENLGFGDPIPANGKITDRILLLGVAAEFLRVEGDFNQSVSWNAKFKQALDSAFRSKSDARLPRRRWLT